MRLTFYSRLVEGRNLFLLFFLFTLIGWVGTPKADNQVFVIGGNHAPPYRIIETEGGKSTFKGIYFDVIKEAAKRAGIKITFKDVPFKRALKSMEQGQQDIMAGPNRTAEREAYMHYIDAPMAAEPKVFYTHAIANDIENFNDLEGYVIGVLRGAKYFPEFDEDDTLQRKPFNDYISAFRVLEKHRIDVVITPEMQGDYLLSQHFAKAPLKKASFKSAGRLSYMTISRQSSLFSKRDHLERVLQAIIGDGTYHKILERYR